MSEELQDNETQKKKKWQTILSSVGSLIVLFSKKRYLLNQYMRLHYSAGKLAFFSVLVGVLISVLILFIPPYLGVANDGIGNKKMLESGLSYLDSQTANTSNNYFERVYEQTIQQKEGISAHLLCVDIAKAVDTYFTKDNLFDIRFLALIYLILWIPGMYLALKAALERVSFFTEGAVLAVLGIIIFSDISYITYFNSLYSDALILICLLYIAGGSMLLHKENKRDKGLIFVITVAGIILILSEKRCFLAGIVIAMFLFAQVRIFAQMEMKLLSVVCGIVLLTGTIIGIYNCGDEFDETAKFHAMTRGVLLQSEDPEDELAHMNIDHSYTVLTDVSLYDAYPIAEISNSLIQNGFLDKYEEEDIMLFYLRHPGALISMWDLGVKAAFDLRRSYCSNYEESAGMPAMGKSIFWSVWSTFKERSAPKTIGYVLILTIVFTVMSGKKVFHKKNIQRWEYVYFTAMLMLVFLCMGDLTYVILKSGDSQFIQYNIISGTVMDLLFYYVMAEILHKLNILEVRNEKNE